MPIIAASPQIWRTSLKLKIRLFHMSAEPGLRTRGNKAGIRKIAYDWLPESHLEAQLLQLGIN